MTEWWRRACVELRAGLRLLLRHLRSLDDVLDHLLLLSPLLAITPPHGTLVVASQTKVFACLASRLAFLTLLPP